MAKRKTKKTVENKEVKNIDLTQPKITEIKNKKEIEEPKEVQEIKNKKEIEEPKEVQEIKNKKEIEEPKEVQEIKNKKEVTENKNKLNKNNKNELNKNDQKLNKIDEIIVAEDGTIIDILEIKAFVDKKEPKFELGDIIPLY